MAICMGFPKKRWGKQKHITPDDLNKLARAISNCVAYDVFWNGETYTRSGYVGAASVGTVSKEDGEVSHHMVNQCATDFLASNPDVIALAESFGVTEITQEHVNSMIHHPLNVVNLPKDEHDPITDLYRSKDKALGVSHRYEYERVQSYQDQMNTALEALHRHSPNRGWERYLDKVDYFRDRKL